MLFLILFSLCILDGAKGLSQNLSLPADCGVSSEDYTITNVPALTEFPWMALIAYNTGNTTRFECTGTIINAHYILTAAQCVHTNIAYVRIGDYDIATELDCIGDELVRLECLNNTQELKVEEKIVHENFSKYNNLIRNDIALLRLKEKIDFSVDNAAPICLPVTLGLQNTSINKNRGRIVVWGLNRANTTAMRKYNVWLTPVEECNEKCKRSHEFEQDVNEYCVRKEDSYNIDIGGPLLFKDINSQYIQYGIISEETNECVFFTKITGYIPWILEIIKE